MRRSVLTFCLLFIGVFLAACSRNAAVETNGLLAVDKINELVNVRISKLADINENMFCVLSENGKHIYTIDKKTKKPVDEIAVSLENPITGICCGSDRIFFFEEDKLYSIDLDSKKMDLLCSFDFEYFIWGKAVYENDKIYVLRYYEYEAEMENVRHDSEDAYVYQGEKLYCVDPETQKIAQVDGIGNIINICRAKENTLFLYGYDNIGGFYICEYDCSNGLTDEKVYLDDVHEQMIDMGYDKDSNTLITVYTDNISTYVMSDMSKKIGELETKLANDSEELLVSEGQVIFVSSGRSVEYTDLTSIGRIENSITAIVDNIYHLPEEIDKCSKKLKIIPMETEEQVATKVLAGDSDYDLLMFSTDWQMVGNILNLGAYYPLNKCDGIAEYLDGCHDYIQESARSEDGSIWMIPYFAAASVILYNDKECDELGINISGMSDYNEWLDIIEGLDRNSPYPYRIAPVWTKLDLLKLYFWDYGAANEGERFDTPLFRKYAEKVKLIENKFMEASQQGSYSLYASELNIDLSSALKANQILLENGLSINLNHDHYYECDDLHFRSLPGLEPESEEKSIVTQYVIIVNPKSKRLKETLSYVSELCGLMKGDEKKLIFKDREFSDDHLRQELYEIIAGGRTELAIPYDVMLYPFQEYIDGKQDLESTIVEINRRVDMFLKE